MLAMAITLLCACILNWSSFVFAAVFQNQMERWPQWREQQIVQNNLGTGMLAVNGAMLLGIVLSVIHCGAPIRTNYDGDGVVQNNNDNENEEDRIAGDRDENQMSNGQSEREQVQSSENREEIGKRTLDVKCIRESICVDLRQELLSQCDNDGDGDGNGNGNENERCRESRTGIQRGHSIDARTFSRASLL